MVDARARANPARPSASATALPGYQALATDPGTDRRLPPRRCCVAYGPLTSKMQRSGAGLAECLRDATRPHHASIERALPLASLGLTLDAYRSVLGVFLGFYGPLEAGLIRVAAKRGDLDLRGREKVPQLRDDLRMLGVSEAGLAAIPTCPAVPQIDAVPRALGCMYVLEGATLGGRIIARDLERRLAIDQGAGGAFLHGYGTETGAMWRSFVARLNRQPPPYDGVLAAAVETFEHFERWLIAQGAPAWRSHPVPT